MSEDKMNNHETPESASVPNTRETPAFTTRRDVQQGVLYVGIDLGTSQTVISSSNGTRAVVESFVGYPRDLVSRKLLNKDVLFGADALKNRLSLQLYRPLEKGVIKYSDDSAGINEEDLEGNLEAAKALIHHVVSLANPSPTDLVYGVIGCPAQASIRNKQSIIEAAREVLDSVVICSEPFAVAYGLGNLAGALVIDIGAGTTDLCRMKGAMPDEADQITLLEAGDHVDDQLYRLFKERCEGAQFTVNMVKRIKERHAFVTESAEPVIVTFPVKGKPVDFDVTEEVRSACSTIIDPIVDAMAALIGSFDPEFQESLRNNVVLAGGGSRIFGLDRALEEALEELGGGRVSAVQEPVFAGANGALKIAYDMPEDTWEQMR
jgi:rod shape-determining protein MreB and related proteins